MPAKELIEKLIRILEKEKDLFGQYNANSEILHRLVVSRNWIELEKILLNLRKEAASLSMADEEREMIISLLKKELNLSEETSFGLLLSRFPEEASCRVNDIKREMRRSIMILQGRMKGIDRYTESQTSALKDVLDVLVPDQKGRIYNKKGAPSTIGTKPMLFSKHF